MLPRTARGLSEPKKLVRDHETSFTAGYAISVLGNCLRKPRWISHPFCVSFFLVLFVLVCFFSCVGISFYMFRYVYSIISQLFHSNSNEYYWSMLYHYWPPLKTIMFVMFIRKHSLISVQPGVFEELPPTTQYAIFNEFRSSVVCCHTSYIFHY